MNTAPVRAANLTKETVALAFALRQRDANTGEHSDRTQALAIELGRVIALSSSTLATLALAAQLHDVGKIGIPDAVLLKPGRLEPDELEIMKTHPQRGHDILSEIPDPGMRAVADIVLHHHEHFAGGGYPNQLKGETIPVLARIIAITDSYDAMATHRPYHRAKPHDEIMRILFEENSHKYDPYLVAKFTTIIGSHQYRYAHPAPA